LSQRIKCKVCDKVFEEGDELNILHDDECEGRDYVNEIKLKDKTIGELVKKTKTEVAGKTFVVTVTVTPSQISIQKLRPITFADGTMYIQITLPVIKKVETEGSTRIINTFGTFYVTSNKKLVHHTSAILDKFQTAEVLEGADFERWKYDDIIEYLTNDETLDICEAYESTEKLFRKYIDFRDDAYYTVITLWVFGTYISKMFSYFPYLDIGGTKGSAKSKVLSLLEKLTYNGKMVSGISSATLTRLVEAYGITLLIDETEGLKNPKHEKAENLLTMLKTSYRTTAQIPINTKSGDTWIPHFYETGTCISLAHINGLDDVLEDRTIPIPMEITLKKGIGNSDPDTDVNNWFSQRDKFYRFALECASEIDELVHEHIEHDLISNRELNQIWKPLIVIAKVFESHGVPDLVRKINVVIQQSHSQKISSNIDENPDVKTVDLLIKYLIVDKSLIRSDKNELSQQDIFNRMTQQDSVDWLKSSKSLGVIFRRLGLAKTRTPKGMVVIITDPILAKLAKQFGLQCEALKNIKLEGVIA